MARLFQTRSCGGQLSAKAALKKSRADGATELVAEFLHLMNVVRQTPRLYLHLENHMFWQRCRLWNKAHVLASLFSY